MAKVGRNAATGAGPTVGQTVGLGVAMLPGGGKVRAALPRDVRDIQRLVTPYADQRILLAKELVGYFESVQEFLVADAGTAERSDIVGCGALHVMWDDLAEIRTLAAAVRVRGTGIGYAIVEALIDRARAMGIRRIFCLTFEVEFFRRQGFREIEGTPVDPSVYTELLMSRDDGVAEFLDLARVKPNTLGNTRMLLEL